MFIWCNIRLLFGSHVRAQDLRPGRHLGHQLLRPVGVSVSYLFFYYCDYDSWFVVTLILISLLQCRARETAGKGDRARTRRSLGSRRFPRLLDQRSHQFHQSRLAVERESSAASPFVNEMILIYILYTWEFCYQSEKYSVQLELFV